MSEEMDSEIKVDINIVKINQQIEDMFIKRDSEVMVKTRSDLFCDICGGRDAVQQLKGSLCDDCLSFYKRAIKEFSLPEGEELICSSCDTRKGSAANCRICRWNRCVAIICGHKSIKSYESPHYLMENVKPFEPIVKNGNYLSEVQTTNALKSSKKSKRGKNRFKLTRTKNKIKKRPNKFMDMVCKVCGDTKTHPHYGIVSCDSCAVFFNRYYKRRNEPLIKKCIQLDNNCLINKEIRNDCKSCRFQACIREGMVYKEGKGRGKWKRQPKKATTST